MFVLNCTRVNPFLIPLARLVSSRLCTLLQYCMYMSVCVPAKQTSPNGPKERIKKISYPRRPKSRGEFLFLLLFPLPLFFASLHPPITSIQSHSSSSFHFLGFILWTISSAPRTHSCIDPYTLSISIPIAYSPPDNISSSHSWWVNLLLVLTK